MLDQSDVRSEDDAPRRFRRVRIAIAALGLVPLLLAACASDEAPETNGGANDTPGAATDATEVDDGGTATDAGAAVDTETLTIRAVRDMSNLDPAWLPSNVDDSIAVNVFEGLVTWDPETGEVVNQLAASFETSEDGLSHTFTLKEGVQFHGGYGELTAEDVKFSFERIAGLTDPPLESTYAGDWATLEEVEVTGTYTGVIRMSEPFAPLMVTTLPGNAGYVISKKAYEELGAEAFATSPIGSGPYQFAEWTPNQQVVLERFEDWGGASLDFTEEPIWQRIVFRPIEDDSAADVALETGEVDFGEVSIAAVPRFEDNPDWGYQKVTTFDYGWVGFNVQDETLSDPRVREAIRLAIDMDAIHAGAFEDQAARAKALISPEMPIGHWAEAPEYERDVDAAQALLDEAGVSGLSLNMMIDEQTGSRALSEIVQANLSDVGIEVSIELLDSSQFYEEARTCEHQLFYMSFSNSADPSWATVWFTTDQIADWNFMCWSNEEFDQLHQQALVEVDPQKRHGMYVRMQEIMDEDVVAHWVMYRTADYVYNPGLVPAITPPKYGKFVPWDFRTGG